jgi:hypothetical protein
MTVSEVKALVTSLKGVLNDTSNVAVKSNPEIAAPLSANDAAVVQLSDNPYSLAKFEKHLADNSRGEGFLSKDGYAFTKKREAETLTSLVDTGYQGFDMATKFLSGQTSYAGRARAMQGLQQASQTSLKFKKIAADLKRLKA